MEKNSTPESYFEALEVRGLPDTPSKKNYFPCHVFKVIFVLSVEFLCNIRIQQPVQYMCNIILL